MFVLFAYLLGSDIVDRNFPKRSERHSRTAMRAIVSTIEVKNIALKKSSVNKQSANRAAGGAEEVKNDDGEAAGSEAGEGVGIRLDSVSAILANSKHKDFAQELSKTPEFIFGLLFGVFLVLTIYVAVYRPDGVPFACVPLVNACWEQYQFGMIAMFLLISFILFASALRVFDEWEEAIDEERAEQQRVDEEEEDRAAAAAEAQAAEAGEGDADANAAAASGEEVGLKGGEEPSLKNELKWSRSSRKPYPRPPPPREPPREQTQMLQPRWRPRKSASPLPMPSSGSLSRSRYQRTLPSSSWVSSSSI